MTGNPARKRKLPKEAAHAGFVHRDIGVKFAIGPLKPGIGYNTRCAVAWTGIQSLRYSEFSITGRRLRKVQDSLAAADTPEQCWKAIHSSLHNFGFEGADVTLAGQNFSQPVPPGSGARMWTVRIPLSGYDEVTLRRSLDSPPAIIAPYAELIGRALPLKLNQFRPHEVPPDLVHWPAKFRTHEASS